MFIEHVNLTVSHLERSLEFYSRLLGLHVRWRGETSDGQPAAHLGTDRFYLAMFQAAEPGRAPVDYSRVGLNHIGFVVDDLEAIRERLHDLGLTEHHEQSYDPGHRIYFFDPDGIEVEIVQYQPGGEPWAESRGEELAV